MDLGGIGKSATAAALESHDCKSREVAKVMGSQLLDKPDIDRAISQILQEEGLTKRYRVRKLKSHVDPPDPNISLKALDQSWKLDGAYLDKHVVLTPSWTDLCQDLAQVVEKKAIRRGTGHHRHGTGNAGAYQARIFKATG